MLFDDKKKKHFLLVAFLMLLLVLPGCRRGSSSDIPEIGIDLVTSPNPPSVGPSTISLTMTEADGTPITGATVELEGNMSHAGMTPVFATARETEPGHYEAPVEFTMGGDWFILVKATLLDGRKLERQINIPGIEAR